MVVEPEQIITELRQLYNALERAKKSWEGKEARDKRELLRILIRSSMLTEDQITRSKDLLKQTRKPKAKTPAKAGNNATAKTPAKPATKKPTKQPSAQK